MSPVQVNATDAARRFSEILNRVRYQGQSFEVKRGREVIARIVPVGTPCPVKVADLTRIFAELPGLDAKERELFRKDLKRVRKDAAPPKSPWA